jgi:O-antigen/teichoic acid export membrane protein
MTSTQSANNSRIAKNTVLLFFRMAVTMIIALYTSRIVLKTLGVTDYGIYNVVGGVVSMLGFVSNSLADASSRYITFAIGKGEVEKLRHLFSCIFSIHLIIAIILFLIAETLGLYFVLEKLVIPENRKLAALFVYQASIITFFITIISVPYDAIVIAYERMSAFAYISITEVSVRLLIVYCLYIIPFDRLIIYSILVLLVQQLLRFIYIKYCHLHFSESHAHWVWDRALSKEIFSYASWVTMGNLATIGYTQGLNVLLNIFFGPVVNAARGIAIQVQGAVYQFFSSFQKTVNPQITKSYSAGDINYMHKLVLYSSKFSFYMSWLVVLPLMYETHIVLKLWLGDVPNHAIAFVRIMLLICLCTALRTPCTVAINATGNIKKFQSLEGGILLTIVPISYFGLKYLKLSPEYVFWVYLIIEVITQHIRVWIVFHQIKLSMIKYLYEVIFPISYVCLGSLIITLFIRNIIINESIGYSIIRILLYVLSILSITFTIGLKSNEKYFIRTKLKNIIFNKLN